MDNMRLIDGDDRPENEVAEFDNIVKVNFENFLEQI
jgi:hypothetical protein